ncbi:MAG: Zn-dependent oligopeptidase [Opitutales bacterium]|nr:Zn-dependent oligopeptidase [Opitutales bacterium]
MYSKLKKPILTTLTSTCILLAALNAGNMGFPTIDNYEERSFQYGVELTIPDFPTSVEEVESITAEVIANLNLAGDEIAGLPSGELTFDNTFRALDLASLEYYKRVLPINVVKNTSPDAELRKAASDAMVKLSKVSVEFDYREDIYLNLKAFADEKPELPEIDQRLVDDILLEYKRLGYDLPLEERTIVESLQKRLKEKGQEFRNNIRESKEIAVFTAEELDGVDPDFLKTIKNDEGGYEINLNIYSQVSKVMRKAHSEATRKEVTRRRASRVMINEKVLTEMVSLRHELASKLGYETWADYRTEIRMAKTGQNVMDFLNNLSQKIQPKLDLELAVLLNIKKEVTGDPEAVLQSWDISYLQEIDKQQTFNVDMEASRRYFPYDKCVRGMFHIYETIFGIHIEEIENPTLWDPSVALYAVSDKESQKPLGLFYIDPFPREGKFTHFAKFSIIPSAELPDGTEQRPTVALICNFPSPTDNAPSLLEYDQVRTLFHEFGHCMHTILTESRHMRFYGTTTPRDFVEAPSQVMEYWLKQKEVLDIFAADWQDQSKMLPGDWIDKVNASEIAHAAVQYRRQLILGLMDMTLHHPEDIEAVKADVVGVTQAIAEEIFLPYPEDTARILSVGHMDGYDSGYYGYAWADVIAADIASIFESAEDRYMNTELGMKLRREIFQTGNTRDVNKSVEAFLNRSSNMDAFIRSLGI